MTQKLPLLVLVRDLIFASRISAAARAAGVNVRMLRDAAALGDVEGTRLIVDLNQAGALEAAVAWKRGATEDPARQVIGFVSHVNVETIARARAAGIDQILPRSRFVKELDAVLSA